MAIKRNTKGFGNAADTPGPVTLADVLAGLQHNDAISATRLRDLRSALQRVAGLLGEEPASPASTSSTTAGPLRILRNPPARSCSEATRGFWDLSPRTDLSS
jgi:hypothetical protein